MATNSEMPRQTVVALFDTRVDADRGMTRLLSLGFLPEHIGLLEAGDVRKRKTNLGIVLGALSGAIVGGVVGALATGLASVGLAIVGSVTGIAFGGWAGAVVGGFFGGDGGNGDESYYVRAIQDGRILVTAEAYDRTGETTAIAVLHDSRAIEVDSLGAGRLNLEFRHPVSFEEAA